MDYRQQREEECHNSGNSHAGINAGVNMLQRAAWAEKDGLEDKAGYIFDSEQMMVVALDVHICLTLIEFRQEFNQESIWQIIGNMALKFGGIMKSVGLEYLLIRQEI